MLIGDVASRFKIRPSAIRYYEEIGLLPKASKINGRRQFSEDVVLRLKVIRTAQSMGFKISEIKTLMSGFDPRARNRKHWQVLAQRKIQELGKLIESAATMKGLLEEAMSCKCPSLASCEVIK